MSTITVTNIKATGETASRSVSGVAAAWCHIDGVFAINNSLNVSSITDEGGSAPNTFSVNITNAMNDSYYVALGSADGTTNPRNCLTQYTSTSSYFVSVIVSNSPTNSTGVIAQTAVIGDLA